MVVGKCTGLAVTLSGWMTRPRVDLQIKLLERYLLSHFEKATMSFFNDSIEFHY